MKDNEPLTVYSSRMYALVVFLGCMVFTAAGIWMLCAGEDPLIGWGNIVFFGGGSLLFVRAALDPRPQLVLDHNGLLDRTLKVGPIPWEQIAEVRLDSVHGIPLLYLELQRPEEVLAHSSRGRRILHAANRAAGFGDLCVSLAGLPVDPTDVMDRIGHHLAAVTDETAFRQPSKPEAPPRAPVGSRPVQ